MRKKIHSYMERIEFNKYWRARKIQKGNLLSRRLEYIDFIRSWLNLKI